MKVWNFVTISGKGPSDVGLLKTQCMPRIDDVKKDMCGKKRLKYKTKIWWSLEMNYGDL